MATQQVGQDESSERRAYRRGRVPANSGRSGRRHLDFQPGHKETIGAVAAGKRQQRALQPRMGKVRELGCHIRHVDSGCAHDLFIFRGQKGARAVDDPAAGARELDRAFEQIPLQLNELIEGFRGLAGARSIVPVVGLLRAGAAR